MPAASQNATKAETTVSVEASEKLWVTRQAFVSVAASSMAIVSAAIKLIKIHLAM